MVDPADPKSTATPAAPREQASPTDGSHSNTGRSASIRDIGRELGELDFEPDDLLASLRPFEPSEPQAAAPPTTPDVVDSAARALGGDLKAAALGQPRFPGQPPLGESAPTASRAPGIGMRMRTRTRGFESNPSVHETDESTSGGFVSASTADVPHSLSPPSLGHNLVRAQASAPEAESPSQRFDGPDVSTIESPAELEELIALPEVREHPLTFTHERPASSHLDHLGLAESFESLATLLEREASAPRHPQERAELGSVASELFALCGRREEAKRCLKDLSLATLPFVATQARQLHFEPTSLEAYGQMLRSDLRSSGTHESRRHLMTLHADVARLIGADDAEQRRHLELSQRAFPSDSRLQLERLTTQLVDCGSSPRVRAPTVADGLGSPEVIRDLFCLRTGTEGTSDSNHPLRTALVARTSLRGMSFDATIFALEKLLSDEGFAAAVSWLIVGLAFHNSAHDTRVLGLLETLLESGDPDAELPWLEHRLANPKLRPSSVELFSLGITRGLEIGDQVALALAVGADQETLRLLMTQLRESLQENDELLPWSVAVHQFAYPSSELEGLEPSARCQWALGMGLGSAPEPTQVRSSRVSNQPGLSLDTLRSLSLYEQSGYDPVLTATLRLWHFTHGGSLTSVASSLVALIPQWSESDRPFLQILAAIMFAQDASVGQAQGLLQTFLHEHGPLEVIARALAELSSDSRQSPQLGGLLGALQNGSRRDALVAEYVISLTQSSPDRTSAPSVESLDGIEHHSLVTFGPSDLSTPWLQPLLALWENQNDSWRGLAQRTPSASEQQTYRLLASFSSKTSASSQSTEGATLPVARVAQDSDGKLPHDEPLPECLLRLESAMSGFSRRPGPDTLADFEWLGEHLSSPSAKRIAQRLAEVLDPDMERFEERLQQFSEFLPNAEGALDAQVKADLVHEAALATELDPERETGVGSLRASQAVLSVAKFDLGAVRTHFLLRSAREGLASTAPEASQLARKLRSKGDTREPLADAFAWLAWTGRVQGDGDDSRLDDAHDLLSYLAEPTSGSPLWSVRRRLHWARTNCDDVEYMQCLSVVRALPSEPLDAATLAIRAAETALRLEQWDQAELHLAEACSHCPDHLVALSMQAEFQEARGNKNAAAMSFEALAFASSMPSHKIAAYLHAAELHEASCLEPSSSGEVEDASGSRRSFCLQQALELDPSRVDAYEQLRDQYRVTRQFDRLESLLTARLLVIDSPDERATLEVERANVLLALGRTDEARGGLERALALTPDHEPTLVLLAQVLETEQLFEDAELHWLTLAQVTTNPDNALHAYRRLASLYETALEQPARAEIAYREIIKRCPSDPAGDKLVAALLKEGNTQGAIEELLALIEPVKDTPLERDRTLELARIYDSELGDRRRAEETLEKVRRRSPHDAAVLRAQAEFFLRARDHAAYSTLVDRALVEARRALGAGRFEANFFEVIATVGQLRDSSDMARVAHATLSAVTRNPSVVPGLGSYALENEFADPLAPEVLSLPLRALLRRTGSILSSVVPLDLRSMRAVPLEEHSKAVAHRLRSLAHGFGINDLDLYLSPALDAVCQPADIEPRALLVGPGFVALESEAVRDALAIRALRILSSNTTALANTSPVELWPLLAAYLTLHLPDYAPPGVDMARVNRLRGAMSRALSTPIAHDLPTLAADVVATIGNRASQLGLAAQQWGSRTALLAVGDPSAILYAIASASGQLDKFESSQERGQESRQAERLKWILRNPEARDIAVFSISDAYLSARAKKFG